MLSTQIIKLLKFSIPTKTPKNSRKFSSGIITPKMVNHESTVKERFNSIKKSPNDKRLYRGLILKNDLKVLLISDETTDKSAACMSVQVGFLSDPDTLPGLAHFCEHMLFLGTQKYPNINEYQQFLAEHGGTSNANTTGATTNYYFDVNPEHLENALDRFSQFFLSPLFTESATELEVNAVHSEHEQHIASDVWRLNQLDHSSADPHCDFATFGTGNRMTLQEQPKANGIDVRKELLNFHDKWYSSNIMSLTVLGKENLDELETVVEKMFSMIKNKKITAPEWTEHPFSNHQFEVKWYIVPIKDIKSLRIIFPSSDQRKHFRAQPAMYVMHLLGHEGEGSLLSELKKAGWGNSLAAGYRKLAPSAYNFFNIVIDLTEDGLNHIDDIMTLVFQYIKMMKTGEPVKWIFDECKEIAQMNFNFKEKSPPIKAVTSIVHDLHECPMDDVLFAPHVPVEWRPDLIKEVMDLLIPEKSRMHIVSKKFQNIVNEKEKWYGTEFKKEKTPCDTISRWNNAELNPNLRLPDRNEFIPTNFDIRANQNLKIDKYPKIIVNNELMRAWFKQDDEFLVPKVNVVFSLSSPLAYMDPLSYNLAYMYISLFEDSLTEYSYNASIAGLSWKLSASKYGVILLVGGYHDKNEIFLKRIMNKMMNFTIDPKRFEILKEKYIRNLKNFQADQPYEHAVYYLAVLLADQVWTKEELLDTTHYITLERLKDFIPQLLSKLYIECLIHGNLSDSEALNTLKTIETELTKDGAHRIMPLLPQQLTLHREISLEDGCHYLYEVKNNFHKPSCTEVYYQCGIQSTESNMLLELLGQIIQQPCYNTLRTEEQLGYIVFSGIRRNNGAQGLRIIVQSTKHPKYVEERIEAFIESSLENLINMSEEEFNRHKTSLATKRLEKPKIMADLTAIFWNEISNQQYNFDRTNIEVAYLMTITKEQILSYFKEAIDNKSLTRRKLSVHIVSMADGGAGLETTDEIKPESKENDNTSSPILITNITSFKSNLPLYPLPKPIGNVSRNGKLSKL